MQPLFNREITHNLFACCLLGLVEVVQTGFMGCLGRATCTKDLLEGCLFLSCGFCAGSRDKSHKKETRNLSKVFNIHRIINFCIDQCTKAKEKLGACCLFLYTVPVMLSMVPCLYLNHPRVSTIGCISPIEDLKKPFFVR